MAKRDGRATLEVIFRVARDPALSPQEKALWTVVRSYDTGEGCYADDAQLGEHLGLSARQVRRIRVPMIRKGYIEQGRFRGPRPVRYRATCPDTDVPPSGAASPDTDDRASRKGARSGKARNPDTDDRARREKPGPKPGHKPGHGCPSTPTPPLVDEYGSTGVRTTGLSNSPPPQRTRKGRVDGKILRRARPVLLEHCLLGSERAQDENGEDIGIGLLLRQLEDLVAEGRDPDEVLGAVTAVRGDESAPPPDAVFSLRWFEVPGDPGRWARCIGAFRKGKPPAFGRGGEAQRVGELLPTTHT